MDKKPRDHPDTMLAKDKEVIARNGRETQVYLKLVLKTHYYAVPNLFLTQSEVTTL